jgi:hypothetical protein
MLSGVRAVCRAYGNKRIHEDNGAFKCRTPRLRDQPGQVCPG